MKCSQCGSETALQCVGMNCHYLERDTDEEQAIHIQGLAATAHRFAIGWINRRCFKEAVGYQQMSANYYAEARRLLNLPT